MGKHGSKAVQAAAFAQLCAAALACMAQTAAWAQAAQPPAPAVTVATPLQREIIEYEEFTGQFAPVKFVEVRSRVSGYLQEIHFEDGQLVKKGDLLFVIDPRPFQAALDSARGQLKESQARVELANRQLARTGKLRQREFAAASAYDQRVEEQRAATAAADVARAAVRIAELDVEFSRVVAPISGRIGRHLVSVGNLVSDGGSGTSTLLTTIVSVDPIYFEFNLSEGAFLTYERAVQSGKLQSTREQLTVYARLVDEPDWPRVGKLDFIDNRIVRTTGTIRARAVFPNSDGFLTPGLFGRIRLPASERHEALLIPDSAIVTDQSNKIVMTVGPDGTVTPKRIRPGPLYDGLRVVRSGLTPEDRIIINGLMRARPGAKVSPQPGEIHGAGEKRPG